MSDFDELIDAAMKMTKVQGRPLISKPDLRIDENEDVFAWNSDYDSYLRIEREFVKRIIRDALLESVSKWAKSIYCSINAASKFPGLVTVVSKENKLICEDKTLIEAVNLIYKESQK